MSTTTTRHRPERPAAATDRRRPGGTGAQRRRGRRPSPLRLLGYLVLTAAAAMYALPFAVQLATAFKTAPEAAQHPLSLVPSAPTLEAFRRLFGLTEDSGVPFLRWLGNSVLVTVLVTAGRVLFDSMAGYALARLPFRGRRVLFVALLSVMAVPPVVLLIPKFLVFGALGIFDTYTAMIVPLLVDATGIFIMRQFFLSIPREVEESARMDGAGTVRIFWSIILPIGRPALITLTILSFQGSWNEFAHFLAATQSQEYETLTTGLARFVSGGLGKGTQYPLKLAAALLSTIPVALLFAFFQRHFIRGANAGAVKQ